MSQLSVHIQNAIDWYPVAVLTGMLLIIGGILALIRKKMTLYWGRKSKMMPRFAGGRSQSFEGDDAVTVGILCIVAGILFIAVSFLLALRAGQ